MSPKNLVLFQKEELISKKPGEIKSIDNTQLSSLNLSPQTCEYAVVQDCLNETTILLKTSNGAKANIMPKYLIRNQNVPLNPNSIVLYQSKKQIGIDLNSWETFSDTVIGYVVDSGDEQKISIGFLKKKVLNILTVSKNNILFQSKHNQELTAGTATYCVISDSKIVFATIPEEKFNPTKQIFCFETDLKEDILQYLTIFFTDVKVNYGYTQKSNRICQIVSEASGDDNSISELNKWLHDSCQYMESLVLDRAIDFETQEDFDFVKDLCANKNLIMRFADGGRHVLIGGGFDAINEAVVAITGSYQIQTWAS